MLTEAQERQLERRENSFFMLWLYKRVRKELLSEYERYILCRDCFRISIYTLAVISLLLPLGLFLETALFAVIPNVVFITKWRDYLQQKSLQPVKKSVDKYR
ncbi:hypothetical protein BTA51_29655 [Hahella sp. CCB-MM4]|uniref:hypothetical protein n=1 Tax=Hahella sp. (strain CCB-MM4) TaxID=1926491 RepID=UPI000B9A6461|nr:hypothetical protein [Hahella sp. CCB-MM4]OZG69789.1 hypothetical protein BTA51_29655 [Hahella sp. CCB-MM4]